MSLGLVGPAKADGYGWPGLSIPQNDPSIGWHASKRLVACGFRSILDMLVFPRDTWIGEARNNSAAPAALPRHEIAQLQLRRQG